MLYKVKTVTPKVLQSGKTVYQIVLEDGTQGSSWDAEFKDAEGKALDFDIVQKEGSQYKDFKIKKAKGFGPGAPRNYKPEALSSAVAWLKGTTDPNTGQPYTKETVIKLADFFHAWIKGS